MGCYLHGFLRLPDRFYNSFYLYRAVCFIWNGKPGVAGSTVIWGDMTTNIMAGSVWSNIYRVNAPNGGTTRPVMKITANTPGLTLKTTRNILD